MRGVASEVWHTQTDGRRRSGDMGGRVTIDFRLMAYIMITSGVVVTGRYNNNSCRREEGVTEGQHAFV